MLLSSRRLSYQEKAKWSFNAYLQAPVHKESLQIILHYLLSGLANAKEDLPASKKKKCNIPPSTAYFKEVHPANEALQKELILLCLGNLYRLLNKLPTLVECMENEAVYRLLHRLKYYFACLGRPDMEKILTKLKAQVDKQASKKSFQNTYQRLCRDVNCIVTYLLMSEDF